MAKIQNKGLNDYIKAMQRLKKDRKTSSEKGYMMVPVYWRTD